MPPPMKLYEVYVAGETKHREVCTSAIEANRVAQRIAEDELVTTEVRPVTAQDIKDRAR